MDQSGFFSSRQNCEAMQAEVGQRYQVSAHYYMPTHANWHANCFDHTLLTGTLPVMHTYGRPDISKEPWSDQVKQCFFQLISSSIVTGIPYKFCKRMLT